MRKKWREEITKAWEKENVGRTWICPVCEGEIKIKKNATARAHLERNHPKELMKQKAEEGVTKAGQQVSWLRRSGYKAGIRDIVEPKHEVPRPMRQWTCEICDSRRAYEERTRRTKGNKEPSISKENGEFKGDHEENPCADDQG